MNFPHSYHCFCFMCSSALSGSNPNFLAWSQYPSESLCCPCVQPAISSTSSKNSQWLSPNLCALTHRCFLPKEFCLILQNKDAFLNCPPILKAGLDSGLIGFQGLLLSSAQAFFTLLLAHLHSSLYSEISENQNFIVNWSVPSLSHIWIVVEVQWICA